MKYCMHCKAKLQDRAVVCTKCGYIQAEPEQQTAIAVSAVSRVPAAVQKTVVPAKSAPPEKSAVAAVPAGQLKTNRGLLKFILLSMITFGIYGIVVMSVISRDINIIASRHDGRKTMHYCWIYFLFSWLTLGIVPMVWCHRLCSRIGGELSRRGISYKFGAGTYWGWGFFGGLILVGPFIYTHKLLKAMNLLAENYNING